VTDGVAHNNTVTLRLLATSDLHSQLMPWDYLADQPSPDRGLARLATLIARARAQVRDCLLLDNGDFLQGSPLCDLLAANGTGGAPHPMIAAMNALRYDAATLGNHEFSHGLPFLTDALQHAGFPVVSANIFTHPDARSFVPPFAILTREVLLDGRPCPLRIGIIGFAPPQMVTWDHQHLAGLITTEDIVTAATRTLPLLRAAGADLVIALCHSGIGARLPSPGMENASTAIAALPGVDVVVAGHTHETFPNANRSHGAGDGDGDGAADGAGDVTDGDGDGVNEPCGSLCGKPAVMPGFFGSHLGVIDLALTHDGHAWRIAGHHSALLPIARRKPGGKLTALVDSDPAIEAIAAAPHAATRAWAQQRIGHNPAPLHSYFALIRACPSVRAIARAQSAHVIRALAGTPYADLPMLSAAAPFRAGGRGGPGNYSFVRMGDLTMRHIPDLYMHPNTLTALQISGADVARWLERSASLYHRITPGAADQPLIDPDFPSFNFDSIDGVTYRIDLSQPPRHDAQGAMLNPAATRIVDLCFDGVPVDPDAQFVLATNSYRTAGSGQFAGAQPDRVIYASGQLNSAVLLAHIQTKGGIPASDPANWQFMPMPGTSVLFDSAPRAVRYTGDLPPGSVEPLALTPEGFLRFRLHL